MNRSGGSVWMWAAIALTVVIALCVSAVASSSQAAGGVAVGIVAVLLSITMIASMTGRFRWLSLIGFLVISHAVLFIGRPAYAIAFEGARSIFTSAPYDEAFVMAEVVSGIGLLAISFGYAIGVGRERSASDMPALEPWPEQRWIAARRWSLVVFVGGLGLYSVYVAQTGVGAYLNSIVAGRNDELREAVSSTAGYFYSGLTFALGAALVGLLYAITFGRRRAALGFGGLVVLVLVPSLLSGSRSAFLPVVVALILLLVRTRSKLVSPLRMVLIVPLVLILGVIAPRIWRDSLSAGGSISAAIGDALSPSQFFGEFLGGLDTAMVDALAVQVSAQESGSLGLLLGRSYLGFIVAPLPRALWGDKPLPTDTYLNQVLFPVTAEKGIGFAFSTYSEPYVNFGLIGVAVVMLVFGLLLGMLARRAQTASFAAFFVYAVAAGYTFALMRGTFTYNAQRLLLPLAPALLVLVLSKRAARHRGATGSQKRSAARTEHLVDARR